MKRKDLILAIAVSVIISSIFSIVITRLTNMPKASESQPTSSKSDAERVRELEIEAKINAQKQADKEAEDKAKWDMYALCIKNSYTTPGQVPTGDTVSECKAAVGINDK
jgi:hypothetical protein